MILSGYDCWKRKGLSWRRKLESVGAETTSSGSPDRPTTDCRQSENRHHQATGAGRAECPPTVQICYSSWWIYATEVF